MRHLTAHKINGLNESLLVQVLDEPGAGGACHAYRIRPNELGIVPNESATKRTMRLALSSCNISFQNGPIAEAGVNGISNEALLAILIDRMEGFQSGEFACTDNAAALACLQDALACMHRRTKERLERGVEGTNQV